MREKREHGPVQPKYRICHGRTMGAYCPCCGHLLTVKHDSCPQCKRVLLW